MYKRQVLPANRDLAGAEVELVDMDERDYRLRHALEPQLKNYDVVLIDCSPSISLLTINALCCAHGVIIPMQCEYYAMEGLTDLCLLYTSQEINKTTRACGLRECDPKNGFSTDKLLFFQLDSQR